MPSRHVVKDFSLTDSFHVLNRGTGQRDIFDDNHDRARFMRTITSRIQGKLNGRVTLRGFCLMSNHFHLVLTQIDEDAITKLMHGAMTSYVMQYNIRHNRVGALFQDRYKAIPLPDTRAIRSVLAYVHLNPGRDYESHEYSSHDLYAGVRKEPWFDSGPATDLFPTAGHYEKFMRQRKRRLKELQNEVSALWTPFDGTPVADPGLAR